MWENKLYWFIFKKKGRKERKWKVYIYDKINIELIIEWVLVIVIIGINWIWN